MPAGQASRERVTGDAVSLAAREGVVGGRAFSAVPFERGDLLLISTAAPTRSDRILAIGCGLVLVCALVATAPFATIPLQGTQALIPAYFVAVLINQIITAALLLGLFAVERSRRVLVLATGYLFAGLMIIPWALSFPGAFPTFGLDGATQSTATIAAINRLGFPVFILVYALGGERGSASRAHGKAALSIIASVAIVTAVVAALSVVILSLAIPLPPFMRDTLVPAPLWQFVPPVALAICAVTILILRARLVSVLDLWLIVVLVSLMIEIVLLAYLSAGVRLSVGWWAGRVYGLVAASTVLIVLLSGTTALYARLARSVLAERRARESRLTVIEAISASIAHEIRQPLSSVELSAAAGLRWLRRDPPDLGEVEAALARIEKVGERAAMVVDSIRTTFKTNQASRSEVDVNTVIDEVIACCREEAMLDRVVMRTDLSGQPARVVIDPLQLHLVLSNLIKNAIDSMCAVSGRPRVLTIASEVDGEGVRISVSDTGTGLAPEHREMIFSAFFTTKEDGMGVGLMFCRSIMEANGGQISVADNLPHGAVFELSLPATDP